MNVPLGKYSEGAVINFVESRRKKKISEELAGFSTNIREFTRASLEAFKSTRLDHFAENLAIIRVSAERKFIFFGESIKGPFLPTNAFRMDSNMS